MSFDLDETLDLLERTPKVLTALLDGLGEDWAKADEGPDTWSAVDILGHLAHGEEDDWVPRARIILEHGDGKPFQPYDRFAQFERFRGWALDELLERFGTLRAANLAEVRGWNLTDDDLSRPGRHPELGAVNLRQLLATWLVHDLNHIAQIVRVLAKRYGDEVGQWKAYLSILKR